MRYGRSPANLKCGCFFNHCMNKEIMTFNGILTNMSILDLCTHLDIGFSLYYLTWTKHSLAIPASIPSYKLSLCIILDICIISYYWMLKVTHNHRQYNFPQQYLYLSFSYLYLILLWESRELRGPDGSLPVSQLLNIFTGCPKIIHFLVIHVVIQTFVTPYVPCSFVITCSIIILSQRCP